MMGMGRRVVELSTWIDVHFIYQRLFSEELLGVVDRSLGYKAACVPQAIHDLVGRQVLGTIQQHLSNFHALRCRHDIVALQ